VWVTACSLELEAGDSWWWLTVAPILAYLAWQLSYYLVVQVGSHPERARGETTAERTHTASMFTYSLPRERRTSELAGRVVSTCAAGLSHPWGSLTVSVTVPPSPPLLLSLAPPASPPLSVCLSHRLSHLSSLTASLTFPPSPPLSPFLPHRLSY
jgi:hypothetical protein